MGGETIVLGAGQCGGGVSLALMRQLCAEHGVDIVTGQLKVESGHHSGTGMYFNEGLSGRRIPRCVLFDTDLASLDAARLSDLKFLFSPDTFQPSGGGSVGECLSTCAQGYFSDGAEVAETIMDAIRREVERCEQIHAFQLAHSVQGGTGSGLAGLMMEKVTDFYPGVLVHTLSHFSSSSDKGSAVEPYNTIFGLARVFENAHLVTLFDDNTPPTHRSARLGVSSISSRMHHFATSNALAAGVVCDVTAPSRLDGEQSCSLRKLAVNLVPYPKLMGTIPCRMCASKAPREQLYSSTRTQPFLHELIMSLLPRRGVTFTMACVERCATASVLNLEREMRRAKSNFPGALCADPVFPLVSRTPPPDANASIAFLVNGSHVRDRLQAALHRFQPLFRRKAFWHSFEEEGMSHDVIRSDAELLRDVACEYDQVASGFVGPDSELWRIKDEKEEVLEEVEEVEEAEKTKEKKEKFRGNTDFETVDWASQEDSFEQKEQSHPDNSTGSSSTRRRFIDSSEYFKAFI